MKKEKELRVYMIEVSDKFLDDKDFYKLSDKEIISHCEETGLIHSIKGFEDAFNHEDIYSDGLLIKFLYV